MKLGLRVCLDPEYTSLTFGVDPNKGMDPGYFFLFFFNINTGGLGLLMRVFQNSVYGLDYHQKQQP